MNLKTQRTRGDPHRQLNDAKPAYDQANYFTGLHTDGLMDPE